MIDEDVEQREDNGNYHLGKEFDVNHEHGS